MIVWHVRDAPWVFFPMNWISKLLILLLKNHAMPKIIYSSQWISWSLLFNMHQVDKTNIEKRIQMPSWCCLSLEIINISEIINTCTSLWLSVSSDSLRLAESSHFQDLPQKEPWKYGVLFFSLFNTRQHYKRDEQSIPLHLNIHIYTSYHMEAY